MVSSMMPHRFITANGRELGSGSMLTERQSLPKAAQLFRQCLHHSKPSPFLQILIPIYQCSNPTRAWPHMNAAKSRAKFGKCCFWASVAGRHWLWRQCQGWQARLWLDSIKAFTASDTTASDLQWQLIKQNYTPLLWKAATQNSFRD